MDRIAVVLFQIALLVVFDERKDRLALGFALSISHSGLEVGDDLAQGLTVEPVLLVDLFVELAVFGLAKRLFRPREGGLLARPLR